MGKLLCPGTPSHTTTSVRTVKRPLEVESVPICAIVFNEKQLSSSWEGGAGPCGLGTILRLLQASWPPLPFSFPEPALCVWRRVTEQTQHRRGRWPEGHTGTEVPNESSLQISSEHIERFRRNVIEPWRLRAGKWPPCDRHLQGLCRVTG